MRKRKFKTNKILYMFEPNTFPIAISILPFFAAINDVISSGKEVPIEIIVRPIKVSDTPKLIAINRAERTTNSPPKTTAKRPLNNINISTLSKT